MIEVIDNINIAYRIESNTHGFVKFSVTAAIEPHFVTKVSVSACVMEVLINPRKNKTKQKSILLKVFAHIYFISESSLFIWLIFENNLHTDNQNLQNRLNKCRIGVCKLPEILLNYHFSSLFRKILNKYSEFHFKYLLGVMHLD